RADRFLTLELRTAFVIARGTLRSILGRCLDLAPAGVPIEYGDSGKPRVAGASPLRFNVSHSGGQALYALTLACEVGVDLERTHRLPDRDLIARRYFSAAEIQDLESLSGDERDAAFFACWTRKEA